MAQHGGHGGIILLGALGVGVYGYLNGWFSGLFGSAPAPQTTPPTKTVINSSGIPDVGTPPLTVATSRAPLNNFNQVWTLPPEFLVAAHPLQPEPTDRFQVVATDPVMTPGQQIQPRGTRTVGIMTAGLVGYHFRGRG